MAIDRNVWDGWANWSEVAASQDLGHVRERITGRGTTWWKENGEPDGFVEAVADIHRDCLLRMGRIARAVDFGCGLGRNGPYLARRFGRLVGLDLPDMIAKLRLEADAGFYSALYGDRAALLSSSEDLDVCYDSVVFQHILNSEYSAAIVRDLVAIPNLRYVISLCSGGLELALGLRGWARVPLILRQEGWTEVYSGNDVNTFNVPHVLRVLKRPS